MANDKVNSGAIFKNDKQKDSWPDYQGTINVEGQEFYISLWIKEGQKGKFFSAALKAKGGTNKPRDPQAPLQSRPLTNNFDDSDIPFMRYEGH